MGVLHVRRMAMVSNSTQTFSELAVQATLLMCFSTSKLYIFKALNAKAKNTNRVVATKRLTVHS